MKILFTCLLLISSIAMSSQEIPSITIGKDKLGITSLDINVEVVGNVATTTYDMLFYNPSSAILEGELAFPLGEGQHVSMLALEVNGKLREAMVVAKEQGRIAFEAVVRRGVDPMLEECYYGHSKTQMGGEISQDMIQGFGPEEFTLKNAKKGAYFIKVNYYGDRYPKLENPTFMKVTMFKNYGKPYETKEIKIIRFTKPRDKQIVAKLDI